ncbi:MAG: hypothetical protein IJ339_05655 [Oscillospiraceae bacterium]|nr:hypothetical protein [Oscillospiraceae bacterium]
MTYTKSKKYVKRAKTDFIGLLKIKDKVLVLICITSLFTADKNSFLSVLPLVVMQMCSDKTAMYLCGGLSVLYYISTFVSTSFYVPCVAFVLVYLLGDFMLQQGSIKPVWFALAVFGLCKGFVLTFGYSSIYWAVLGAEATALMFLPQIVCDGVKTVKENREISNGMQFFEVSAAMIVFAVALSGIKVYGFDFSVCLLLTSAFYFAEKENIALSLAAFLCMTLFLTQDKNFSLLFSGFAVIYIGSTFLLSQNNKGYIQAALLSIAVTFVFITKFNSFVFAVSAASALAAAFLINKFYPVQITAKAYETSADSDYLQLAQKIDKLNRCFNFLGHTVIDISNLLVKEDIPHDVSDAVAQAVCKKCKNNTVCWQQHYSHTQSQFSNYAHCLQKGKQAGFDSLFISRCEKLQQITQAFDSSNKLENAKQLIYQSGKYNQKLLQNQFLTI